MVRKKTAKKKSTKYVTISLRIEPEHHAMFEEYARSRSISLSAFLRMAGLEYLERIKGAKNP